MSSYSIAEAKNKLSKLIHRAVEGEDVVITRHGQPIVALKPVRRQPRRMTEADFKWLEEHRARLTPATTAAGTLVRQMRDEEWGR
jgi:prevent-host-death family protein